MSDHQTVISIIIPTKDRAELLMQTIGSVRRQTCGDWEAIVVDDGSRDDTAARVAELRREEPRVRYHLLDGGRRGAPAARNAGVALSRGQYAIFLDADDLLAPHCLAQRLAVMHSRPELDFAVFPCQLFQEQAADIPLLWNSAGGDDDLDRFLANDTPWQTSSPIWRGDALAKVGPWDEQALSAQDWEFHIRALVAGLRYDRHGSVDCYWRVPGVGRASIGVDAITAEHAVNRVGVLGRLLRILRQCDVLSPRRKLLMAGRYFRAAEAVAQKVSRREARRVWRTVHDERLVSQAQYLLGAFYFAMHGRHSLRRRAARWLQRRWPRELLGLHSPTLLKTPTDPQHVPAVSVLMPVHNAERYLEAAVSSIVRQTFRDWELIIIDDGSTDHSSDILRMYALEDHRIRLIRQENRGLVATLNEGLRLCRAQLIARMDGDDISFPQRLERQVAYLRDHPECVVVGGRTVLIDPFGQFIGNMQEPLTHEEIDAMLLSGSGGGAICHPLAMMRREAMERVGGYRAECTDSEDLDLFLRLGEIGRLANLPEVLLYYRRHPQSVSHLKHENQARMRRGIIAEAYERRGMQMPQDWSFTPWKPKPVPLQLREWGWKALRGGRRQVARQLALDAFRRSPLDLESWRLMYCALRGR